MISVLYLIASIISGIRNDIWTATLCFGFALALLGIRLLISLDEANKTYKKDPDASGLSDLFNQAI
jgi:hypothetical protein